MRPERHGIPDPRRLVSLKRRALQLVPGHPERVLEVERVHACLDGLPGVRMNGSDLRGLMSRSAARAASPACYALSPRHSRLVVCCLRLYEEKSPLDRARWPSDGGRVRSRSEPFEWISRNPVALRASDCCFGGLPVPVATSQRFSTFVQASSQCRPHFSAHFHTGPDGAGKRPVACHADVVQDWDKEGSHDGRTSGHR